MPCSASYALNTQVTLTAQPDAGSSFSGWFGGGCSGVGTCQVTLNNAKVVMAMFSKPASGFTASYYHTDRLGSVRAMTDASGTLVGDRHDYAPFGEDAAPITGNPLRFGGKELDAETALHYFEARYYRQTWGRFTQVDPLHVGAAMLDPQQWNRYAYARNNPLAYSDFSGLSADFYVTIWGNNPPGTPPNGGPQYYNGVGVLSGAGMTPGGQGAAGQCAGFDNNGNFYMWQWCEGAIDEYYGSTVPFQESGPTGSGSPKEKEPDEKKPGGDNGGNNGNGNNGSGSQTSESPKKPCGGGFFVWFGGDYKLPLGLKLESLALVQWDSQDGGSHGGLVGVGVGAAVAALEAVRSWADGAVHYGGLLLREAKGASRAFGKAVGRPGEIDLGWLVGREDGHTSVGGYIGLGVVGAGGYATLGSC